MVERLRNDQYAAMLARAYYEPDEYEALTVDEEDRHLERMLNAVEAMERGGHIIGPKSLIAANRP